MIIRTIIRIIILIKIIKLAWFAYVISIGKLWIARDLI